MMLGNSPKSMLFLARCHKSYLYTQKNLNGKPLITNAGTCLYLLLFFNIRIDVYTMVATGLGLKLASIVNFG